jgi:ribosomal protein L16/L10AE
MRGAFGKPTGTVARVDIGQIIFSVRTKDNNKATVIEALRRAKVFIWCLLTQRNLKNDTDLFEFKYSTNSLDVKKL